MDIIIRGFYASLLMGTTIAAIWGIAATTSGSGIQPWGLFGAWLASWFCASAWYRMREKD